MTEALSIEIPEELEAATRGMLRRAGETELSLATAESCTGGLLASLLTDIEGCSHVFERGFVAYSDEAKQEVLGVAPRILENDGAVSKAAAIAMAEGALARSHADVAIAVTGFAGPAGPDDEEGLVHLACARRGREIAHRELHCGAAGRGPIRIGCLKAAIEMMDAMLD